MKIAIIEGKRPTLMPEGPEIERRIFGPDAEIRWYGSLKSGEYKKALGDIDAVITRPGTPFSKEMVGSLKKAKAIISLGVGYDHICLKTAEKMGIFVCNVPDYGTAEVADTTVAMLLAHQRKVNLFCDKTSRSGNFEWDWRVYRPIKRTRDMRIGIIGLGRIGTAVAIRLKGFGYAISFYDPYLGRGFEKSMGLDRSHSMETLIKSSDAISIHTPLTEETEGIIDEKFFGRMKPAGILINTARGGLYKSADIILHYLKAHPELRIGTDVWPDEPPRDHPLLTAWTKREAWLGDRLIVSPHAAFYSEAAMKDIRAFAAEVAKTILTGGKPYNIVSGAKKNG